MFLDGWFRVQSKYTNADKSPFWVVDDLTWQLGAGSK